MASLLETALDRDDTASSEPAVSTLPLRIGHFAVLRRLGEGGMGVVYAAYDEELDRRVAIKLLRLGSRNQPEGRTRMLREAQGMARLSHTNVVQVYEVGEFGDQLYLAMEFVRGEDLRTWLEAAPRSWLAVRAKYLEAGRGLAAAHVAGLVHRDFKPENVVIGDGGCAKVLDFGLVTRAGMPEPEALSLRSGETSLDIELTGEGTLIGTPAYMSPEQHLRTAVDARSDQFSFCVALWEALYGTRPFAGSTTAELTANVLRGRIVQPRDDRHVPGWLRTALLRGLSIDPAARYSSMDALLADLSRDPGALRRRVAVGAAALVVIAGASWGGYSLAEPVGICNDAHAGLAGVWDDARRIAVGDAIAATGLPYARDTADRVVAGLDLHAEGWADQRAMACEEHRRGLQSAAVFDLRTVCLAQRRRELASLVDLLVEGGADVVPRAIDAVRGLPSTARCEDAAALMAAHQRVAPPDGPAAVVAVEQLRGRLMRAQQTLSLGRSVTAGAMQPLIEEAHALGHDPLIAEARLVAAQASDFNSDFVAAEAHAWVGWLAAERAGDVARRAELAVWMVSLLGGRLARFDEARRWGEMAEALLVHLGGDGGLSIALELAWSAQAREHGDYARSEAHARRGLAGSRRVFGREHSRTASALNALAGALRLQGRWQEAISMYQEARAIDEVVLGPRHPETAAPINNIGNVYHSVNRYAESLPYYEKALEIRREAYGQWHADVGAGLSNVANALGTLGRNREALEHHEEALKIRERVFGPDHPEVANSLANAALTLAELGRHEEAFAALQRALTIQERTLGRDHIDVAYTLNSLGNALFEDRRYEEAAAHYERAMAVTIAALGPEHPDVAVWQVNLGSTVLRMGRTAGGREVIERGIALTERTLGPDNLQLFNGLELLADLELKNREPARARALAERALALSGAASLSADTIAELRFTLARALWSDPDQRAAALVLADETAVMLRASPTRKPDVLTAIEAWTAEQRGATSSTRRSGRP